MKRDRRRYSYWLLNREKRLDEARVCGSIERRTNRLYTTMHGIKEPNHVQGQVVCVRSDHFNKGRYVFEYILAKNIHGYG